MYVFIFIQSLPKIKKKTTKERKILRQEKSKLWTNTRFHLKSYFTDLDQTLILVSLHRWPSKETYKKVTINFLKKRKLQDGLSF
jgi:hypothetical protein